VTAWLRDMLAYLMGAPQGVPLAGWAFVLFSQLAVWVLCSLFVETTVVMYRRGRGQKIVRCDDDTPLRLELYERFASYLGSAP